MKRNTKTYIINERNFLFNVTTFNQLFEHQCRKENMNKLQYEIELGESLGVSGNAIHAWRFGINSPSDIEIIKNLALIFEINDYMELLKRKLGANFEENIVEFGKDNNL